MITLYNIDCINTEDWNNDAENTALPSDFFFSFVYSLGEHKILFKNKNKKHVTDH